MLIQVIHPLAPLFRTSLIGLSQTTNWLVKLGHMTSRGQMVVAFTEFYSYRVIKRKCSID